MKIIYVISVYHLLKPEKPQSVLEQATGIAPIYPELNISLKPIPVHISISESQGQCSQSTSALYPVSIEKSPSTQKKPVIKSLLLTFIILSIFIFIALGYSQSFFENTTTMASTGQIYNNAGALSTTSITGAGVYSTGWFSDWKKLGALAIMVSVFMVSFAYMMGIGFESRELKVWAGVELSQVAVSALILMGAIGIIGFFDLIANEAAFNSGITVNGVNPCEGITIPCGMRMSQIYIDDMQVVAKETAYEFLTKNIEHAQKSSKSIGLSCDSMWCIWASGFYRPDAGMSMAIDRYTMLFDDVTKIIASLSAQRYFLDMLAYAIGPLFMLLGIVLRSLWFTRKLGGLLIAIAIAVMVIYPLTYVLSWFTLKVAVYGDAAVPQGQLVSCPDSCQYVPNTSAYCNSACSACSSQCRIIPFPSALSGTCNETACYACPASCKVVRSMPECGVGGQYACTTCPSFCKTNLSMQSNCAACMGLPAFCRVNRKNVTDETAPPLDIEKSECTAGIYGALYNSCKAAGCLDTLPSLSVTDCNTYPACTPAGGCPTECRVNFNQTKEDVGDYCNNKCMGCPSFCKATPPVPSSNNGCAQMPLSDNYTLYKCQSCEPYCRYGAAVSTTTFGDNTTYSQPYPKDPSKLGASVNITDPYEDICFRLQEDNSNGCSPAYCPNVCRNTWWPATCETYAPTNTSPTYMMPCASCPNMARINLTYGATGALMPPNTYYYNSTSYAANCSSTTLTPNKCRGECLTHITIPSAAENPSCLDFTSVIPSSPNTGLSSPYSNPTSASGGVLPLQTAVLNPPGSDALNCKYCARDCRYGDPADPKCNVSFIYQFTSGYSPELSNVCDSCNGDPPGTNANSCFCNVTSVNSTSAWTLGTTPSLGGANTIYYSWDALPSGITAACATPYNNLNATKIAAGKALQCACRLQAGAPVANACQAYVGPVPSTSTTAPTNPFLQNPSPVLPLISLPTAPAAGSASALNCKYCPAKCQHGNLTDPECNQQLSYEFASEAYSTTSAGCDTCNGNPAGSNANNCYCNPSSSTPGATYSGNMSDYIYCLVNSMVPWKASPCSCVLSSVPVTGQSPAACNACNAGTSCTCDTATAVAGTRVEVSQTEYDACAKSLPSSGASPAPSCLGTSETTTTGGGVPSIAKSKTDRSISMSQKKSPYFGELAAGGNGVAPFSSFSTLSSARYPGTDLSALTSLAGEPWEGGFITSSTLQIAGARENDILSLIGEGTCSGTPTKNCAQIGLDSCTTYKISGCTYSDGTCDVNSATANATRDCMNGGTNKCSPYTSPTNCETHNCASTTSPTYGCKWTTTSCQGNFASCGVITSSNGCLAAGCTWASGSGGGTTVTKYYKQALTYSTQSSSYTCTNKTYTAQPRTIETACSNTYGTCSDECKDRIYCQDIYYTKQPRVTTNVCSSSYNVCTSACKPTTPPTPPTCSDYVGIPRTCNSIQPTYTNSSVVTDPATGQLKEVNNTVVNSEYCLNATKDHTFCKQCPKIYRVPGLEIVADSPDRYDCTFANCPLSCREPPPPIDTTTCLPVEVGFCKNCPARCRVVLPNGAYPVGCEAYPGCTNCPNTCKSTVPNNPCELCFECQEGCRTIPPINVNCPDMCTAESGPTDFKPGDFLSRSGSDFEKVGTLAMPAYLLPLFNIVILIAFIRVLSPLLGGDVEIPGLSKII